MKHKHNKTNGERRLALFKILHVHIAVSADESNVTKANYYVYFGKTNVHVHYRRPNAQVCKIKKVWIL